MKVWTPIFNLFAVLMIAFLIIAFREIEETNNRQFEELRLRYAMDYATEAAFRQTIGDGDDSLDYEDLGNVKINPSLALDTFKSLICLSYDMSLSEENFRHIENYIPTGILFSNDGYYILEMVEVDTDTSDTLEGNEYQLHWSLKKPYTVRMGNTYYATNIYNEDWASVTLTGDGGARNIVIADGDEFIEGGINTYLNRALIKRHVSEIVTKDVNYQILKRNFENNTNAKVASFYLPAGNSMTTINDIDRPTLMMFLQGVDFAGINLKIDATSVGGAKTIRKIQTLAFIQDGLKYYCYEGQIQGAEWGNVNVVEFYDSIEEATFNGYRPHFEYLSKPIKGNKDKKPNE